MDALDLHGDLSVSEVGRALPALVGEAPSRTGDAYFMYPLSGAVARTLCTMAGIPPLPGGSRYGRWTWALYDRFLCGNLIERWADAEPWRPIKARDGWLAMRDEESDLRVIVCLGRRVQAAVIPYLCATPFHEWVQEAGRHYVTIPHPSGLNRLLNDPAECERCEETLREALERAK